MNLSTSEIEEDVLNSSHSSSTNHTACLEGDSARCYLVPSKERKNIGYPGVPCFPQLTLGLLETAGRIAPKPRAPNSEGRRAAYSLFGAEGDHLIPPTDASPEKLVTDHMTDT